MEASTIRVSKAGVKWVIPN